MRNFCNELKTVTEAVNCDDVKTSQQRPHQSPNLQYTKATVELKNKKQNRTKSQSHYTDKKPT